MKTRLIIAAGMLLTATSFAQTTAETKQNAKAAAVIEEHKPSVTGKGAGEAHSKAAVKTEEVTTAQENTVSAVEKVKHEKKEKKELVVDQVAKEKAAAQSVVSQDANVATHSSGRATVKINQGNNKTEEDASLNTGTDVVVVNHGQLVKQENHGAIVRAAAATASTTHGVKAVAVKTHDKVHATGSTVVKTPAKKVKAVKIKPASVRATTRANIRSGIRIN